jgi:hypothetical protein
MPEFQFKTMGPILVAFACLAPAHAGPLGDLAGQMKPGEWRELATNLAKDTILYRNVNGKVYYGDLSATWSNYLAWNSATEEIYWLGAPHLQPFAFLRYSAKDNLWHSETEVPDCMRLPGYEGCFNHGYDEGTIDRARGVFYFSSVGRLFSYRIADKAWTQWTQAELASARAAGMAFFPPHGTLAFVIGPAAAEGGLVQLIDPAARKVETVAKDLEMGGYSNTIEYSPGHRKLYFGGGGGSRHFYSMDSAKEITRLADAPAELTCVGTSLAVDPVTGDPLFLATDNGFHGYSPATGAWKALASPPQKLNGSTSVAAMATDIPEHGVVFYMSPSLKKVFLYKHAAAGTPVRAPSAVAKGMRFNARAGGGLVIALPEGREAEGSLEILDLAGRRAALLPAAERVHWRPEREFSGPVAVRWIVAGKVAAARLAFPAPTHGPDGA